MPQSWRVTSQPLLDHVPVTAGHAPPPPSPQHVANTLWALASLGTAPGAEAWEALGRRALAKAADFLPFNVAHLLWALATLALDPGDDLGL